MDDRVAWWWSMVLSLCGSGSVVDDERLPGYASSTARLHRPMRLGQAAAAVLLPHFLR
jgi:hypothetical protein